jgi:hypothetical protein
MGPPRGFALAFFFAAGFRPYFSVVFTDVSPRLNPLIAPGADACDARRRPKRARAG